MKLSKWIMILLIISLLFHIKTGLDIISMKKEIFNLNLSINTVNNSVSNIVSSSIYQIEEALKKENSLVNEFKYEFIELKDKIALFQLSLKPRTYNKGEKIFFLLKAGNDESKLIPAETANDINYTADIQLSVFDGANIDLVVESGDTKMTERLGSISPAIEKFAADIHAEPIGGSMKYIKDGAYLFFINYEFGLFYESPNAKITLNDVSIIVEVNDVVIDTIPMPRSQKGRYQYLTKMEDYRIPSMPGDNIILYAMVKDDNGFNYKCNLEAWTIKDNGDIKSAWDLFDFRKVVDIY